MSDVAVFNGGSEVLFTDPLDDSGDGDVTLPKQSYYTLDEIVKLLNDLGFNVDDQRDVQF